MAPFHLENTMKFKTEIHLNNWYGITASAGDEIDVPEHLVEKAKAMPFLKKGRKRAKDSD